MKTLLCCLVLATASVGCMTDGASHNQVEAQLSDPSCSDSLQDWVDLCNDGNGIPADLCVGDIGELTCLLPGTALDNLERFCDDRGGIFAFVLLEASCLFLEP